MSPRKTKGLAPACRPEDLEAAIQDFFRQPMTEAAWTSANVLGGIAARLVKGRRLTEAEAAIVVARAAYTLSWLGQNADALGAAGLVTSAGDTVTHIDRAIYEAGAVCVVKKAGISDGCMRRKLGLG